MQRKTDHEHLAALVQYMGRTGAPWENVATPENAAKGWGPRMSEQHYMHAMGRAATGQDPEPRIEGEHAETVPWKDYAPHKQAHIEKHMRETYGITGPLVEARAGAFLDAALTRHKAARPDFAPFPASTLPGRDWYLNEGHELAGRVRQQNTELETPIDVGRAINGAAIISPNTVWQAGSRKVNADLTVSAARLIGTPSEDLRVEARHAAHLKRDAEARPNSVLARSMAQGLDPQSLVGDRNVGNRSSEELALLGSYSGTSTKPNRKKRADGSVEITPNVNFASDAYGESPPPIPTLAFIPEAQSRHNVTNALKVMRKETSIEQALSRNARKPRTFNTNLLTPFGVESAGRSTVDRWEADALTGGALGNPLPQIPMGRGNAQVLSEEERDNGIYAFLEHHAAKAAGKRGLFPHEGQSSRWVHIKGMTEGFGQFDDARPDDPATKGERLRALADFDAASVRGMRGAGKTRRKAPTRKQMK